MSVESHPEWATPPPGGFHADDLDRLPDLPAHTELIDGSLVFVSPQASFHTLILKVLELGLDRTIPAEYLTRREMTVKLGPKQRPEPDLLVVRADAITTLRQTNFLPEDVILAVEVVSPDSEVRDRERKPQLYARSGIPHFWRVENVDDRAVVYVYEIDPATSAYSLTGIHHKQLKADLPYPIDIDLTKIDRL